MTSVASQDPRQPGERSPRSAQRANALADRLEQGARALAAFASALTEAEWQTRLPKDGRKIGVVVHHVANMYPLEIQLAQTLAGGKPIDGRDLGRRQRDECRGTPRRTTPSRRRPRSICSSATAPRPRPPSGRSATRSSIGPRTVSLYADAPLTCQFLLEDHAVRHSYHHLARIRAALKR